MTMTVMSRQMTFCLRQGRRQCIQNRPSLVNASSSSSPDIKSLDELRDLLNQTVDESEKKRVLEVESEYRRYMGESMPSEVTDVMWNKLAKAQSESERRMLWDNFAVMESLKQSYNIQLQRHRQFVNKWRSNRIAYVMDQQGKVFDGKLKDDQGFSTAGPIMSRLFSRVDEKRMKDTHIMQYNFALQFGQPLVFDFGLPYNMNNQQIKQAVMALKHIYKYNLAQWEPFDIYLCNLESFAQYLKTDSNHDFRLNKNIFETSSPPTKMWNETNQSFLDCFPKHKIVYLSHEAKEPLTSYSHDDIYVIGALGDQRKRDTCLGFPKAKELGLRTAKFDVDRYFYRLKRGNPNLLHAFWALTDAKDTDGDWAFSMRRLPLSRRVRWKNEYKDSFTDLSANFCGNRNRFWNDNDDLIDNVEDNGSDIAVLADRCFENHRVTRLERNGPLTRRRGSEEGDREVADEGIDALPREGEEENATETTTRSE